VRTDITQWLASGQRGLSSEAMALCALGMQQRKPWTGKEHPHDPADLNRCILLVDAAPGIKAHFDKIAELSSSWARIIAHWEELRDLFIAEVGYNWSTRESAPRTYDRMQEILEGV